MTFYSTEFVCVFFVFTGKVLRSISVGFERKTETQDHLPGGSYDPCTYQTSQTESKQQTGAQHVTGK